MSLSYPQDQSVQLSYTSFPFTTPNLDNYTTSNYVSNISNILDTKINTKQNILTAATSLLGDGANITNLTYGNITGKPTNFQADWNTTIINKPTYFPIDPSLYYTQTQVNNLNTNSCNYTTSTSNILDTKINTKQDILTAATSLLGNGANITNLNANNFSSGILSVSRGGIGTATLGNNQVLLGNTTNNIKSSANLIYDTVNNRLGVGTNAASYTLDINGTTRILGGTNISNIVFDSDTVYTQQLLFTSGARSFNLGRSISGDKFGFFSSGGGAPDPDPHFILDRTGGSLKTIVYGSLGVNTIDLTYRLNVNGSFNSTSLYQNGTLINFSSYATNTDLNTSNTNSSNYTTITSNILDTKINTKQNNISTYTITGATGGTFDFSLGTLTLGMPTTYTSLSIASLTSATSILYQGTELSTTFATKQASISTYTITGATGGTFGFSLGTLTLGMPNNYTQNMNISNLITPTSFLYQGTELSTTLGTKQATLTFTSPLVNTTNTITFNESAITTLTNFYNKTTSDTRYLQLTGGNISGQINISTSTIDNQILITTTGTTNYASVRFKNNINNYGYIGVGATGLSGYYSSNLFLEATKSIVFNSGGQTSSSSGSPVMMLTNNGNLIINAANSSSGGTKGIIFRNGYDTSTTNYNCSILTYDHDGNNFCDGLSINGWDGISFCTNGNTRNERMRIDVNGNVGIGTIAARARLDVYNQDAIIRATGEGGTTTLYLGTPFTADSALKCALICQGLGSWSRSKLHISLNNTANNSTTYNAAIADTCATFDYNGNVGIGNTIPLDDSGVNTFLCVGDSSISNSYGNLILASRNGNGTSTRHYRMTYDTFYNSFTIGDFGNNNTIGTYVQQVFIYYTAPAGSIVVGSSGLVTMQFGYTTSDERIKTDITTIDNALWKVSQLRGVEYTHIQENIKSIGIIAQEVENIIPEVVYTDTERDNLKSVNYNGLVGLLINAIKEQQEQINDIKGMIKNILYKNSII